MVITRAEQADEEDPVSAIFRYHAESRIIVYAWVNDEETKRPYGSGDDVYRVFQKML